METNIGRGEARALAKRARRLLERMERARALEHSYQNTVRAAADAHIACQVVATLRSLPVEELNRDRSGLRLGELKNSGLETLGDLDGLSEAALERVNGIGAQSASLIRLRIDSMKDRIRASARIRLSADDTSQTSLDLIRSLYLYRRSEAVLSGLLALQKQYGTSLSRDAKTIEDATGLLGWTFGSSSGRDSVRACAQSLRALLDGGLTARAEELLQALDTLRLPDAETAFADFSANAAAYAATLETLCPQLVGSGQKEYGLPAELAEAVSSEPLELTGLNATLRHYQEWGVRFILNRKKVLLGDEMGLGKTMQAIAAMVSLRNGGETHFMVVCPASVLSNWCREIEKFSNLRTERLHGLSTLTGLKRWKQEGGVAVTTYETCSGFVLPAEQRLGLLVVDEAHYVKNPEAKRTLAVRLLLKHADRALLMTGTALENRVDEMIEVIRLLDTQLASRLNSLSFMSSAPEFRQAASSVYFRRKREEVLTELPEKTEIEEWCSLGREERALYENYVLQKDFMGARRVSWHGKDLKHSSKAEHLREILEMAREEQRKVIVFSFFLETMEKLQKDLGDCCMGPINGSVTPLKRQQILDEFEQAAPGTVLLAQIQAGGTGLNIQAASVVILCEPQIKPSLETQAISRAYRMGQARNVLVYRLLAEKTIDERILEMLGEKQQSFELFADASAAAEEAREIDARDYGTILSCEIERIKAEKKTLQNEAVPVSIEAHSERKDGSV